MWLEIKLHGGNIKSNYVSRNSRPPSEVDVWLELHILLRNHTHPRLKTAQPLIITSNAFLREDCDNNVYMSERWWTEGELNTSATVYWHCGRAGGIQHHLPNYCLTYHGRLSFVQSHYYCTQKSLEDLQYKITLDSKVYWWKKANFWSNLKLSMSVDFSTSPECQDYDPEKTTKLIMKDWGRWRWHLKFTVRFKSLLNFIKFYTHGSPISVHLYIITVHMYCMYSTCVHHVMSLPVPAWWHWSGCRGSSSRSRSQGSLGSGVPSLTGALSGAGAGAEGWEPARRWEPSTATPDQGTAHGTSQPAHQQQPALCITPGNTSSILIIKTLKLN